MTRRSTASFGFSGAARPLVLRYSTSVEAYALSQLANDEVLVVDGGTSDSPTVSVDEAGARVTPIQETRVYVLAGTSTYQFVVKTQLLSVGVDPSSHSTTLTPVGGSLQQFATATIAKSVLAATGATIQVLYTPTIDPVPASQIDVFADPVQSAVGTGSVGGDTGPSFGVGNWKRHALFAPPGGSILIVAPPEMTEHDFYART
jgi:hypothetical protein